jgi:hypothetical protein
MTPGPTQEEFFEETFAALEKEWSARHLPALFDAVYFAQIHRIALPPWCAQGVMNLIINRFNAASGNKGRSRYVLDFAHQLRWQTLSRMFAKRGIEYTKRTGRPKDAAGMIAEARQEASHLLRKTVAAGSPRQIQDSFDLVEDARNSGTAARFSFDRM